MNIYDFDKTIYGGDSTVDFFRFVLARHLRVLGCVPKILFTAIKYKCGKCTKKRFKEVFFCFLPKLSDVDAEVEEFWRLKSKKIMSWYLNIKRKDDIIISASPNFLLEPICKKLDVSLIATLMDKNTGEIIGENCKGEEKVRRLEERFGKPEIESFYSDSLSDLPLAKISDRAYLVKGKKISDWHIKEEPNTHGDSK